VFGVGIIRFSGCFWVVYYIRGRFVIGFGEGVCGFCGGIFGFCGEFGSFVGF